MNVTLRGGPAGGGIAAVGALVAQVVAMNLAAGYPGLGSLEIVNDAVIVVWLPSALLICLLAAAAGAWYGVDPRDFDGYGTGARTWLGVVVAGAVVAVCSVLIAGRVLAGAPHEAGLALVMLAILLAVALGAGTVSLLSRSGIGGHVVGVGLLTIWLGLVARAVLADQVAPDTASADGIGLLDPSAVDTARTWLPVLLGLGVLVGVAVVGGLVPREAGPLGVAAVALTPLVLYGASVLLGAFVVGADALDTLPPRVWLWLAASSLVGGILALAVTWLRTR